MEAGEEPAEVADEHVSGAGELVGAEDAAGEGLAGHAPMTSPVVPKRVPSS